MVAHTIFSPHTKLLPIFQIDTVSLIFRSKNGRTGRKVTGIAAMPGEDRILITSNDSRIRLYDLRDLSLVCKYKGYTNVSSPIKACFSPDGRYITSGSENQCVFLWSTNHVPQVKFKKIVLPPFNVYPCIN